jgi:hypothetical protein
MIVDGSVDHLDWTPSLRGPKRLRSLSLKFDAFAPADKSHMELQIAWLRENAWSSKGAPPSNSFSLSAGMTKPSAKPATGS